MPTYLSLSLCEKDDEIITQNTKSFDILLLVLFTRNVTGCYIFDIKF